MKTRLVAWALICLVAALAGSAFFPHLAGAMRAGGVLAFIAVVIAEIAVSAAGLRRGERSLFDTAMRAVPEQQEIPSDLQRIRRNFGLRAYSPAEFDYRLRGDLQRLARHRLLIAHGVDPALQHEAARSHLGPVLYGALYEGPGTRTLGTADLAHLVDLIEEV